MKLKYFIFILIIGIGFLNSCNKDDDNSSEQGRINGKWNLSNINGVIDGRSIAFDTGEIQWTFNNKQNTLKIENNSGNNNSYILNSGLYN